MRPDPEEMDLEPAGAAERSPETASIFGAGGRLSAAHPSYERREGQEWMALAVEQALREGRRLLIEAGTGVGKTLAYLVPAALSGRRVIVSTGTKNLQDQIIDKDLPFVTDRLGIRVRATVVKGRDNYLCIRRYRDYDRAPLLPSIQESEAYENVRAWAPGTEAGDRAEVEGLPEGASFWRKINARSDTCTGTRCEDYEACFLTKVRRKAADSEIVIVNHHLFFADLALREDAFGKVLPDYDAVIFDEAHQLEEVATLFFGFSCSSARVAELADDGGRMLARAGGPRRGAGAVAAGDETDPEDDDLSEFEDTAPGGGAGTRARPRSRRKARGRRGSTGIPEAEELRQAAEEFFVPMSEFPGRQTLNAATRGRGFDERCERLKRALEALRKASSAVNPPTEESAALERRTREVDAQLGFIARADDESYVYWIDVRGRSVVLSASPVDVSHLLADSLFGKIRSAVLTSATLSVDEDFSFIRERLGIGAADERIVPSPFDYTTQAVLYLPSSMPEPRDSGYKDRMLREIEELIGISRGRAFLLFTSYAELRRVEEALRGRTRHPLLVQGEKPRAVLLEEFRESGDAILLGAASFWHGVDVAGEALSLVVIDKIPFDVPNDPLVSARIERIRALGGDPFRDYQIPSAAIELKQGLGRLIRSRADRGILAVLDARLTTRGYGARLLRALPPFPVVTDQEQVRRFFHSRR